MEGGTVSTMEGLVTALKTVLTTDAMFANLTALVPVIGGVLLFAFTYRIVRKMISKASRGKAGIQ